MNARLPDAPPVPLTVVNFPDPVMEDFDVPRVNNHGYPQVGEKRERKDLAEWLMEPRDLELEKEVEKNKEMHWPSLPKPDRFMMQSGWVDVKLKTKHEIW